MEAVEAYFVKTLTAAQPVFIVLPIGHSAISWAFLAWEGVLLAIDYCKRVIIRTFEFVWLSNLCNLGLRKIDFFYLLLQHLYALLCCACEVRRRNFFLKRNIRGVVSPACQLPITLILLIKSYGNSKNGSVLSFFWVISSLPRCCQFHLFEHCHESFLSYKFIVVLLLLGKILSNIVNLLLVCWNRPIKHFFWAHFFHNMLSYCLYIFKRCVVLPAMCSPALIIKITFDSIVHIIALYDMLVINLIGFLNLWERALLGRWSVLCDSLQTLRVFFNCFLGIFFLILEIFFSIIQILVTNFAVVFTKVFLNVLSWFFNRVSDFVILKLYFLVASIILFCKDVNLGNAVIILLVLFILFT